MLYDIWVKSRKGDLKKLRFRDWFIIFITSVLFISFITLPKIFHYRGLFDAATWIIVFQPPFVLLFFVFNRELRNTFEKSISLILSLGLIFLLVGSLVWDYAVFIEPQRLVVREETINLSGDYENIKVVLISDIHMGPIKDDEFLKKVIERLNTVANDELSKEEQIILLIPGDFVAGKFEDAELLYPLGNLDEKYKTYAVLGNHDFDLFNNNSKEKVGDNGLYLADEVTRILEENRVHVLRNESIEVNEGVYVAGVDDIWSTTADPRLTLAGLKEEDFIIYLGHNPDIVLDLESNDTLRNRVDLVATGHTHGGEIRLPTLGFTEKDTFTFVPLPILLGQEYDQGYFEYGIGSEDESTIPLYITSGVGQTGTKARLFNPPEIVILMIE